MIGSILLVVQKSYMTNVPSFYLLDYSPSLPNTNNPSLALIGRNPFHACFANFTAMKDEKYFSYLAFT